jgi:hypothetical protein
MPTMNTQILVGALGFSKPSGMLDISVITVALALLGFWIWMLVDCANRIRKDVRYIGWLVFIFFTYAIGALAYFFFGRHTPNPTT